MVAEKNRSGARPGGPVIVAHRGYAKEYPENTLESLEAAIEAGAAFVEFDVQMTADRVPVVLHDETLRRTAGRPECIMDLDLSDLEDVEVNEHARLGDRFTGVKIRTVADTVGQIGNRARMFVELKEQSLHRFGVEKMVNRVMDDIRAHGENCIVTSFSEDSLTAARRLGAAKIAWVARDWNQSQRKIAENLRPDYLFFNHEKIPAAPAPLWEGPWHWVLYEVTTPQSALEFYDRGIDFIESMAVGEMMSEPRIREARPV